MIASHVVGLGMGFDVGVQVAFLRKPLVTDGTRVRFLSSV